MLSTVSRRLFRKTLHRSENGYVLLTAIVFMLAASFGDHVVAHLR